MTEKSFLRNLFVLLGGTAASQAILVAVTPILTRMYTPADFGVLATLTGVLSVLCILSSFRYAQVLTIVNSETERHNILVLCNVITVFNVALSAVLIGLFGEQTLGRFDLSVDPMILWLVPLGFLFVGLQNTYRLLHIGRRNFRVVAASQVAKTMATVVLQLSLFTFGAIGISIGYVLGFGFAVLVMVVPAIREIARSSEASLTGMCAAAYRYRDFPIYSSWAGLLNNFSQYLPHFLFPFYFGVAGTGLFLLAQRMTFAPVSILVKTTADVLTPYAAEAHREGRLGALVLRAVGSLSAIASIPCVLIVIVSPWLFPFLFGAEWASAGVLAQMLSLTVYFNIIGNPLTRLFGVMEQQRLGLMFNIVLFLARVPAIMAGGIMDNISAAVLLYSVASAIVWGGLVLYFGRLLEIGTLTLLKALFLPCALPILGFVPYFVISYLGLGQEWVLGSLAVGFVVILVDAGMKLRHHAKPLRKSRTGS